MSKGSKRRPQSERGNYSEGYELAFGGWIKMELDPPGCPHELRRFSSGLYWRPMEDAISEYTTSKAGAIE